MDQQSQRTSSFSPADLPTKRKRGRPRKDENPVIGKRNPMMAASDSMRKSKEVTDKSDDVNGGMVGQVVTGVIEGSFDAGYLLNVKVGDTDTHLRGVVFLPGRFTPITAANDVAPHVKMYNRKEIPIAVLNPQTELHNSVPLSGQGGNVPELSDQFLSPELWTPIQNPPENESASVVVTMAANVPNNDAGLSLGGNEVPPQTLDSGLESQSTSTMAQLDHHKAVEHDEALLECEASPLIKGSKPESASGPVVDIVPGVEIATKEPQIQHQDVSLDLKRNELLHDEVKNPNLELQTPLFAEHKAMSPEQMKEPVEILMEEQVSPQKDIAQDTQPELAIETLRGTGASLSNGRPASDSADAAELGSHPMLQTSQPAMMLEGEVTPAVSKLASKEYVIPGIMEPQVHSSGTTSNIENGVKDDLLPQS
ncbi:uncharacterized protein LOC121264188 [Juglans microcarpa x Juglans regia]|uniref:uncharacterized protein LOC121264188 n=1 Tax=Juglans microcarpa x Juglans regia TaxID=2249226 RepID=UPI001B7EAC92|nr:uncharacterized protein LOC121264188 [Juglans microcarpa x Juglans regia]XP_041023194.1 uncharacterized protein LOC121264188 [Juglans microcarpa x Juglans regia]XP_041023195.1 uncharacterized protein LOC121264188 [Juglans microcarpa x Juglans regia]